MTRCEKCGKYHDIGMSSCPKTYYYTDDLSIEEEYWNEIEEHSLARVCTHISENIEADDASLLFSDDGEIVFIKMPTGEIKKISLTAYVEYDFTELETINNND